MSENDPVALCPKLLREQFARMFGGKDHRAALIGMPEGQNCGHHASWLGALKLLSQSGAELVYSSPAAFVERDVIADRIGTGVLFLMGALTADTASAQQLAGLIASLPNRIVFLPECIPAGWTVPANLTTAIAGHADIVVLARDAVAKRRVDEAFGANVAAELAPPLSFGMGPQERRTPPQYDIVWVARTGRRDSSVEAAARLSSQSAERLELPDFPDGMGIDVVVRQRPPTVMLTDWSSLVFRHQEARIASNRIDPRVRAEAYANRGLFIVSLGRVAITDRPGAHNFCLLLGIPHVFVEDGSGSNRALYECWSPPTDFCRFAETPAKAWSEARNMLRQLNGE